MSDEQGDGQLPSAEEAIQQQQEENESQQEAASEEPTTDKEVEAPASEESGPQGEPEEAGAVKSTEPAESPEVKQATTPEPEGEQTSDSTAAAVAEDTKPEEAEEPKTPPQEESEPVQTEPVQTEPEQSEPVQTEPEESEPVQTEPEEPEATSKADEEWVVVEPPPPQADEQQEGDSKPEANGEKADTAAVAAGNGAEVAAGDGAEGGAVTVEFEVGPEEPKVEVKRPLSPGDDTKIGEYLRQLQLGLDLVKIKKGKWYSRIYRLDDDLLSISWNSRSKKGAKAKIAIGCINEVRSGRSTDSFKISSSTHPDQLCFSVVYIDNAACKTLDLAALSEVERNACVEALEALMAEIKGERQSKVQERWLRDMFQEADRNGDGTLDVKEVVRMMKALNVGTSTKILKKKFKAADKDGDYDGKLNFEEFCTLFRELAGRPEIQRLFSLVSSRLDWLSVSDLQKYLQLEQGEGVSLEECERLVQQYEPTDAGKAKGFLSIDGFTQFLLGEECDVFDRKHRSVYQDMSRPLSHYFIASSHNTYLLEDQLKGPSSTEAYIRALRKGCRCVELDCWDGENGEPVIYHGHTLTSKILFRDAISAINEHAFVASEYPVILSVENHCSVPQQNRMAEIMKEVFQEALYDARRNDDALMLPSPGELKRKILVKGKKLKRELEEQGAEEEEEEGDVSDEDEAAEIDAQNLPKQDPPKPSEEPKKEQAAASASDKPAGEPAAAGEAEGGNKTEGGASEEATKTDDGSSKPEEKKEAESPTKSRTTRSFSFRSRQKKQSSGTPPPAAAKKIKLSRSLSGCINYVQSVHFKSFEGLESALCYHMSSFGEGSAYKIAGNDPHKFVRYNRRQISRIYPGGSRVTSTNYNPVPMWNCGSQIVALNYQTSCSAMDYNDGKFMQNGGCGYVLKPDIMNEELSHFDPRQKHSRSGAKLITIKVVSGQQLPKPGDKDGEIIDPYVCINIVGTAEDTQLFKTKVVQDNGFNPVWNETFQAVVRAPELALVRFKVMDKDLNQDDFIGQFTLPFESISPGYRHVHLLRNGGNKIDNGSLFVHVTIQDFIGTVRHLPWQQRKLRSTVKVKRHREYPEVHAVGPLEVSEQLKAGGVLVHRAVDLREDFLFALLHFKESCGCAAQAGVADCMQLFSTRVKGKGITVALQSVGEEPKVYRLILGAEGELPESVAHIAEAFDLLNHAIQRLLAEGSKLASDLEAVNSKCKEQHDSLKEHLRQNPRNYEKALEHFCSAVFTCAAEERRLKAARESAAEVLVKLSDAAVTVGFEVKTQL